MADSSLTSAVKGVSSDGFMMTVQPAARAGAVFQALRSFSRDDNLLPSMHLPHLDRIVPWDTGRPQAFVSHLAAAGGQPTLTFVRRRQ